jgi:5'-nucleotidase
MSAAMEAAIDGIPAVGFSLLDFAFDADFTAAKHFAEIVIRELLNNGLPNACLLNVNVPKLPIDEIKGIRVCRQAVAKWEEEFDKRVDPSGAAYYWLTGKFENKDKGEDTDVWALENEYVSIVPVQFDLTNYHGITFINNNWNLNE